MEYEVKELFPATGEGKKLIGWYTLLNGSEKMGQITIMDEKMRFEIFKKGKQIADFSDELVEKIINGKISDEDIERMGAEYSCDCNPCKRNNSCPYSTVLS